MEMASAVLFNVSKVVLDLDDVPIEASNALSAVSLDSVAAGTMATVIEIDRNQSNLYRRLTQLGLVPGTKLKVIRVAPLGCPVQIELRGFCLALRLDEAAAVFVSI